MNPQLERLHDYPFTKLAHLLDQVPLASSLSPIALTIGEPQHPAPQVAVDALQRELANLNQYPSTQGSTALRETIADWLCQRYDLVAATIDPATMVLPVVGSREALFAIAQTVVDISEKDCQPLVIIPSPFYQIYEGAAIMAGAEPLYLPCSKATGFLPDLDAITEEQWRRCQLIYICNPSNPTGVVPPLSFYQRLISLADTYDFIIASDECYSEIYFDEAQPPLGLLAVCRQLGRDDYGRCLVFNSLSKRSNLAGMRSGFVAGCPFIIHNFLRYRTYHGSAMPNHHQAASIVAWGDEAHVVQNRRLYREKMLQVVPLLQTIGEVVIPQAGFCLWLKTSIDDELLVQSAYQHFNLKLLPGQYLARTVEGENPGSCFIRIALVQSVEVCVEGAQRLVAAVEAW
tara:strand:+ start:738 stop:1943 length:1206 start_codon:yes stop_codon:yes gene_type:complete